MHGLGIGSSILYLAVGAIGYPVGAGIMIVTADKIERKYLIFGATVVWLIGMLLIGTLANGAVVTAGSFLASLHWDPTSRWPIPSPPRTSRPACAPAGSPWLTEAGTRGGAVGALLLPTLVTGTTFFLGFAVIGITGLLAGLIALGGPKTSGRSLEKVTQ